MRKINGLWYSLYGTDSTSLELSGKASEIYGDSDYQIFEHVTRSTGEITYLLTINSDPIRYDLTAAGVNAFLEADFDDLLD